MKQHKKFLFFMFSDELNGVVCNAGRTDGIMIVKFRGNIVFVIDIKSLMKSVFLLQQQMTDGTISEIPPVFQNLCQCQVFLFESRNQRVDIFSETTENRFVFSEVIQREYGEFMDSACVISNGWKLIYNFVTKQYELYNLAEDGDEINNALGTNDDIERMLKMKLAKWSNANRIKPKSTKQKDALTDQEKKKLKSLGYIK